MSIKFDVFTERIDLADELEEEYRKAARPVVREAVDMLVAETKANARRITGESQPEGFPARQEGDLERSFKRGRIRLGRDKLSISGEMVSDLTYEEVNSVEYGHAKPGEKGGAKHVAPRPFIRPAVATVEPKIQRLFEEQL
jgi:hypothetical protein